MSLLENLILYQLLNCNKKKSSHKTNMHQTFFIENQSLLVLQHLKLILRNKENGNVIMRSFYNRWRVLRACECDHLLMKTRSGC